MDNLNNLPDMDLKIAIVGKGNVGSHLYNALSPVFTTVEVNSRFLNSFPLDCNVAIICVKDDAISEVAAKIRGRVDIICHTSGSVSIDILRPYSKHQGVFYPLQTFSKNSKIDYSIIPFFIEGSDEHTLQILDQMAQKISNNVQVCDSERRRSLHLASVFACNFTNAMALIAGEILENNGFSTDVVRPLLQQTFAKLSSMSAGEAQTGPAVRKDLSTIEKHLEMLKSDDDLNQLYALMSKIIQEKCSKN